MLISTSRFGMIEIDSDRIIEMREGMLGFPSHRRFALIQTAIDPVFFWLQSVDDPHLAFVVCDPLAFVPDYQAGVRRDDLEALGVTDVSELQTVVVVNKVDGYLTANLLGPLVIGANTRLGRQLVLSDKRYTTRHRLMPAVSPQAVSRTA